MEMINRMMDNETEKIEVRRAGAQSEECGCGTAAQQSDGDYRVEREWEVFIGFRYDIRRRSASLHRNIFGIRA